MLEDSFLNVDQLFSTADFEIIISGSDNIVVKYK